MSYRIKITLPNPVMAQLEAVAARRGEPASRIAAQMVCGQLSGDQAGERRRATSVPAPADAGELDDPDRHAPWIELVMGDPSWRRQMWGGIVALHGRYPRALAHLKDGWWENSSHVETLCALVVWRDWIDVAADDPRHELAFQAQLTDYGQLLRQEGGGVTTTWTPGAPPAEWTTPQHSSGSRSTSAISADLMSSPQRVPGTLEQSTECV